MQTQFKIQNEEIIGLQIIIIIERNMRFEKCRWCGKTYNPHHHRQQYCSTKCYENSRREYNRKWMRKRRIDERNGNIINDRSILNVGTGQLGAHRAQSEEEEINKIKKEKRRLGI